MKKLIINLVLLCLSLNSFASTGSALVLDNVVKDYQYAINVEWDQKDKDFFEKKNAIFLDQLSRLLEQGQVSEKSLLSYAESKIGSKEQLQALKLKLSMAKPQSSAELSRLLNEIAQSSAPRGASWNGAGGVAWFGATFLMLGLIVYLALTVKDKICVEESTETSWQCDSSTDPWGHVYSTSCGYDTYCTKWEVEVK